MRIVVIDDEVTIQMVAYRILNKEGYEVIQATTGEKGLEYIENPDSPVDLVLLDWMMPGMSGLQAYQRIREFSRDLPIIISTGYQIDWADHGLESDAKLKFLKKPYRAGNLLATVKNLAST